MVYRPNSAKVKNLKTKDYLGKARLIAAADQGNTFTGFAGTEAKRIATFSDTSRDDRPLDSISFAASNLVKPNLHSKSRQQSEPPVDRNMFPPTPPPDQDQAKPAVVAADTSPPSNQPGMTARANSVRNPPLRVDPSKGEHTSRPEPLDLSKATLNKELPRLGTTRTASEPRGPTRKYSSTRSHRDRDPTSSRGRLFMETTPLRHSNGADADIDEDRQEFYDMYRSAHSDHADRTNRLSDGQQLPQQKRHRRPSRTRQRSPGSGRHRPRPISEDEEDVAQPSNESSFSDFEILNQSAGLSRPPPPAPSSSYGAASHSRGTSRSRRGLELKNIRVKVHSGDDTRYIMVAPDVDFQDFVDRVREKFGLRVRFKLKVRDEGDLITMADSDDWDMAVQSVKREAANEGGDMGKMEVRIDHLCLPFPIRLALLVMLTVDGINFRCGSKRFLDDGSFSTSLSNTLYYGNYKLHLQISFWILDTDFRSRVFAVHHYVLHGKTPIFRSRIVGLGV